MHSDPFQPGQEWCQDQNFSFIYELRHGQFCYISLHLEVFVVKAQTFIIFKHWPNVSKSRFYSSRYSDIRGLTGISTPLQSSANLDKARLTWLQKITCNAGWFCTQVSMKKFARCRGHGVKKYQRPGSKQPFFAVFPCQITSGMISVCWQHCLQQANHVSDMQIKVYNKPR